MSKKTKRRKTKKAKTEKKGLFNRGLLKVAVSVAVLGCAVLIFTTERDCYSKKSEIAALQTQVDAYNAENAELQRILDSDDISEYMEKIAQEEYGYAYPDERRFYETSRD